MRNKTSQNWIVIALIVGMNWSGVFAVGQTLAYYNDTETSSENTFSAGSLDFALAPVSHAKSIGLAEEVSVSSVLVNSGTLDWQYALETEKIRGDDDFCSALKLEAKLNGIEKYDGSLLSFDAQFLTTLGTWKFNIELPVDAVGVTHGDRCEVDFVYKGWQKEIPLYEDGGFTDEERINVTLTSRMIALNEFLPRPNGVAYGFDFGNDSSDMPQGEWVELYNNGTEAVDLTGWYTRDATNGEGNKIEITALNTAPATTIIGGKSWLVVYMNKPVLNNTGDTVRLFDNADNLIDSHIYVSNDFCEIEPSPGDENSTDASGECGGVPPNKSYARMPDGIGEWVDPIPTPGGANRLNTVEDMIVTQDISSSPENVPVDDTSASDELTPAEEANIVEIQTEESESVPITEKNAETEEPAETEENVTEPEELIQNEEQPSAETKPEGTVDEPPQNGESATETLPAEEPPTGSPLEPSSEGPAGEQSPDAVNLTGQATI